MVTKRTEEIKNDKIQRILGIYTKLMDGKTVNKQEIAARYNVHPRSIQRDIKDITDFLERDELNTGVFNSVIYDKNADGYRLQYENVYKLSPQQILAICKILLDSRAFVKEEMSEIIDKLIHAAVDNCDFYILPHAARFPYVRRIYHLHIPLICKIIGVVCD